MPSMTWQFILFSYLLSLSLLSFSPCSVHFCLLFSPCSVPTPIQFLLLLHYFYTFKVKHIGYEHSLSIHIIQPQTSTDQGQWWPQICPSGFRISIVRLNTPPYSSIRPSTHCSCWELWIHLWKVPNPLAAPMTQVSSPIPFYIIMGTVSVTLNQCALHLAFDTCVFHFNFDGFIFDEI